MRFQKTAVLSAGSRFWRCTTQDITKMGGLYQEMPIVRA
jgi:NADH:ubiquinone oxidoreductase subunit 5 (subunit L)/multisubunit Na+/H+ antiporter MnhA subunit